MMLRTSLISSLLALSIPTVHAQLNGIYTVGGGDSDFPTLQNAVVSLNSLGCTGPVTFRIRNGDYSSSVQLFNGMDLGYPLVIESESGHAEDVIVAISQVYDSEDITFRWLTVHPILNSSTNWPYKGLEVTFSRYITFEHCIIQGTPGVSYQNGISVAKGKGHRFEHNIFRDLDHAMVYSSVALGGMTSNQHTEFNRIRYNTFESIRMVAIRIAGDIRDSIDVAYNTINGSPKGIYMDGTTYGLQQIYIHHNLLRGLTDTGIEAQNTLNDYWPIVIRDNMIIGGHAEHTGHSTPDGNVYTPFCKSILVREVDCPVFIHANSIFGGVQIYNSDKVELLNNCLHTDSSMVLVTTSDEEPLVSDHNDMHRGDGGPLIKHGSWAWYEDLASFQAGSGLDAHSVSVDPEYTNDTLDLHATHPLIQYAGTPLEDLINDFDDEPRDPVHPDIGADEFNAALLPPYAWFNWSCPDGLTVPLLDMSVRPGTYAWDFGDGGTSAEIDPVHTFPAAGTYDVSLIVTNIYGTDTVTFPVTTGTLAEMIQVNGQDLNISPGFSDYQWYLGGTAIDGADAYVLHATEEGGYSVTYMDTSGCEHSSAVLQFVMGIADLDRTPLLHLRPVPATDELYVNGPWPAGTRVKLTVLDAMGRQVLLRDHRMGAALPLNGLPPGSYTLAVTGPSAERCTVRFVIR